MRISKRFFLVAAAALAAPAARAQVTVIDMIPVTQSQETVRDSEPNLAIDPAQPLRMVGSAFTDDPGGTRNGVVFLSTDGGSHWTLTVPILSGSAAGTCISAFCDITERFSGSGGRLYLSDLTADGLGNTALRVSRFVDIFGAAVPDNLEGRSGPGSQFPDQPYLQAATVLGGATGVGNDRVFFGVNDRMPGVGSKTATVDHTLNAVPPSPAGFSSARIEVRATPSQDGASIRTAIHPDGTIYAVFFGWRTASTQDVVVVRDDHWASGATPFTDLHDLGDGLAGQRVVIGGPLAPLGAMLGNQRVGISQMSIAVDPTNSDIVYVAWGDGASGPSQALHVRHSIDRGQHWDMSDLRTISTATNPALAINSQGRVGFLYQKLGNPGSGNRWRTHLELSSDAFASAPTDVFLADVPDSQGSYGGSNTIGDYVHLITADRDFYGVFSAFNTPDTANFPSGVTYRREADFGTHQLFTNASHTTTTPGSIDPYFFHVADISAEADFYVRDWTDSPSSHDQGQEPSTHSVFYTTSDVWNRVTDTAGPLGAAPASELPQEAMSGSNFAYVRVGRKGAAPAMSPPVVVTAHFLYADFGLGMPYGSMGPGADPTLTFNPADTELNLLDGHGFSWTLPAGHSTHTCIAVEISAPQDPFTPPSLNGHSPGWPTTDLAVLNDNNKAQRNIIFPGATDNTDTTAYALIRNAADFRRDVVVRMDADPRVLRRLGRTHLAACGLQGTDFKAGGRIVFPAMAPGEERMLRLDIALPLGAPAKGLSLPLRFTELRDGAAVNGFSVAVRPISVNALIQETLVRQRQVFFRLGVAFKSPEAAALAERTRDLLRQERISPARYLEILPKLIPLFEKAVASFTPGTAAPCGPDPMLDLQRLRALKPGAVKALVAAQARFLESLDAAMTVRQHAAK
jgi:hypothetical protein